MIHGEYAENIFIAGGQKSFFKLDPESLAVSLKGRGIQTKWINESSMKTVHNGMRIDHLNRQLERFPDISISTRERPIALFYALENRQIKAAGGLCFNFLTHFSISHFVIILVIGAVIISLEEQWIFNR